jgi:hypothetical protein
MTHRFYLNDDWLFTEQFENSLMAPEYPENTLQSVRLPHTCKETPFHYFDESLYQMVSGYRRHLHIPTEWQGKRILLTFEGERFVKIVKRGLLTGMRDSDGLQGLFRVFCCSHPLLKVLVKKPVFA